MKKEWNLKLMYTSPKDPKIEKDLANMERAYAAFEKKYRNKKTFQTNENALLTALNDYVALGKKVSEMPIYYHHYILALNSSDAKSIAEVSKYGDRYTKAENKVLFFSIALGKISKANQKKFLSSKKLEKYHYFLKTVFESAKHDLSEAEEKILNLKSQTSRSLWIQGSEKLEGKQMVEFEGADIPLPAAFFKIPSLPTAKRRKLHDAVMTKLHEISDFAESEINAVYTDKKINDELRGYKHPYSATVLSYENTEKSVIGMVEAVTDNFDISKRFYKLKKRLLKLDTLYYADRSASIGEIKKKFDFESSSELLLEILYGMKKEYGDIFARFLKDGHIDVYPKQGKSGGAFCSSSTHGPTLVLLNHADNFNSFTTLAHEMGHAIHSERSKKQPAYYEGYTTSVAETASTMFEAFAFNTVFETLSEKEKVIALHDKIQDDISTIFRQIACFNFEYDLHMQIREKGALSKEEMARLMNKHMSNYLGPAVKLKENDGYFFVSWSHIRNFFYVYSYTYGQLISKVLHQKYLEDPKYIESIDEFLTAGSSKSPEAIFGDIGIKTNQKLFESGLESISRDIDSLEKLTKKK